MARLRKMGVFPHFMRLGKIQAHFTGIGWIGELSAFGPARNRLRRFCGPQRTPNGALGDGPKAGLRVVFRVGLGQILVKFFDMVTGQI